MTGVSPLLVCFVSEFSAFCGFLWFLQNQLVFFPTWWLCFAKCTSLAICLDQRGAFFWSEWIPFDLLSGIQGIVNTQQHLSASSLLHGAMSLGNSNIVKYVKLELKRQHLVMLAFASWRWFSVLQVFVLLMYCRFYWITVWTFTDSVTQCSGYSDYITLTPPKCCFALFPSIWQERRTLQIQTEGVCFLQHFTGKMIRVCCQSKKQLFVSISDLIRKPDDVNEWIEAVYLSEKVEVCSMFIDSHILYKSSLLIAIFKLIRCQHMLNATCVLAVKCFWCYKATATGNARFASGSY